MGEQAFRSYVLGIAFRFSIFVVIVQQRGDIIGYQQHWE